MSSTPAPTPPAKPVVPVRTAGIDIRRTASLRRVDSLFKAMSSDFLLREQFVTEPTQMLSEYVNSARVSAEQADVSDQFLYAVMSSPPLLTWLRDYSLKAGGRTPTREEFVHDVLNAAVAARAAPVVIALARATVERQDILGGNGVAAAILELIAYGGRIVAQTEMSTGHSTGTEMSTGHVFQTSGQVFHTEMSTGHSTGTEMSTGHVFQTSGQVFHTEMSTGHSTGTEMSTGHGTGTEMSTGQVFQTSGQVFHTEMSTGHSTGTEMSTGHSTGTEMSTGHIIGSDWFRAGHQRVALAALAEYAIQLRNVGALNRIWVR